MKPIRITFTTDWGGNIDELLDSFRYYTPGHDDKWGELQAVKDPASADYLVVLNGLPEWRSTGFSLQGIRKKLRRLFGRRLNAVMNHPSKLYFQMEPPEIRQPHDNPDEFLAYCSHEEHYHLANWHIRRPFNELAGLPPPSSPGNLKSLSAIVSSKRITEAQEQRIRVIEDISRKFPNTEVFGYGHSPGSFSGTYKGNLDYSESCKFRGLNGYRYSLAFENTSHTNYFTEKLIDCFLSWCKPIYWGCPNISDYFPEESLAVVDLFDPNVADRILEEISKPVNYEALREARSLVLYKYNMWPSIEHQILKLERNNPGL